MGRRFNMKTLAIETTFWVCKNILEIKGRTSQNDGSELRYDAANGAQSDNPVVVNFSLVSSECTVTANGMKVSNSNGVYAHKDFIETDYSNGKESKISGEVFEDILTKQTLETMSVPSLQADEQRRESREVTLFGKVAAHISCDKHLLSGVTLRIFFVRSKLEFAWIFDGDAKNYKTTLSQANLYVREMTASDQVFTAIDKT